MEIMSRIKDYRINSINLYVETTFGEYLSFADQIIKNNELQRKRVKTSKSVYSLLKDDLKKGCVMPPLVLAVTKTDVIDADEIDEEELLEYIKENTDDVLILDGPQRTYTLLDARSEMEKAGKKRCNSFLDIHYALKYMWRLTDLEFCTEC